MLLMTDRNRIQDRDERRKRYDANISSQKGIDQEALDEKLKPTKLDVKIEPADVLCGRGKTAYHHVGNKRFRDAVADALPDYFKAVNRYEKSLVVHSIVDEIQSAGGRFLRNNYITGTWYELSDQQAKEKVGHAVRDAATSSESKRKKNPKPTREEEKALDPDKKLSPGEVPNLHQAFTALSPGRLRRHQQTAAQHPLHLSASSSVSSTRSSPSIPTSATAAFARSAAPAPESEVGTSKPIPTSGAQARQQEQQPKLEEGRQLDPLHHPGTAHSPRGRLKQQPPPAATSLAVAATVKSQTAVHPAHHAVEPLDANKRLAQELLLQQYEHQRPTSISTHAQAQGQIQTHGTDQKREHSPGEDHDNDGFLAKIDSVLGPLPQNQTDPILGQLPPPAPPPNPSEPMEGDVFDEEQRRKTGQGRHR